MTAKEYLQQIFYINKKIQRMQRQREDLRNDLFSLKSPTGNMTADKVQSSLTGDAMLRLIAKVDDIERDIVRQLDTLVDAKKHITEQIDALDDERYRTLLFDRYVFFFTWEQVAVDMNYRIKWVYELHGNALKSFAEKYSEELQK